MAMLRNRVGLLAEWFFATVFLGNRHLLLGVLFVAAAVALSPATGVF
jgi:hypothetical protein